jgi:FMN reductase
VGAAVPTPGLALAEADLPRLPEVLEEWHATVAPQVRAALKDVALTARSHANAGRVAGARCR